LGYAPGVWLSRGNGQESLLAMRSPVLTGAGSCAEFISMEMGVPLRAKGFCNVNQLFDSHFEAAEQIEVVRGSQSALYGSNAIHGLINIVLPPIEQAQSAQLDFGEHDFYRLHHQTGWQTDQTDWLMTTTLSHDGGFQDSSGYRQQKLSLGNQMRFDNWQVTNWLSLTHLNQDTAGYLQRGEDAFQNESLLRVNDFPDAYRNNLALRLISQWQKAVAEDEWLIKPFLRVNRMDFLMHFLPGTPVEENGHHSLGAQLQWRRSVSEYLQITLGSDWELTKGYLKQTQYGSTDSASAFLREVLPAGKHYDYQVDAISVGVFSALQWTLNDDQQITAALRGDYRAYDYDNRMLDGNSRDDGSLCGFGGCRYTRPADRKDSFFNPSLSLGWRLKLSERQQTYVRLDRSFRAPHTAELYRLQNGQQLADIDSVNAGQIELGTRRLFTGGYLELNLYQMDKNDAIYQDANRQYLNGLDTRHRGLEIESFYQLAASLSLKLSASYARHRYQNNPRNGPVIKGNTIDTAPRTLASAMLQWQRSENTLFSFEMQHTGHYFLEPENQHTYPGHTLFNLYWHQTLSESTALKLKVLNLFDKRYAERADFAFGNYRYFVGEPRQLMLSFSWHE